MRSQTVLFLTLVATAAGQQVADEDFRPVIDQPAYAAGQGPRVAIDGAHHNFHTAEGRYHAFAELLRRDGYQVSGSEQKFTKEMLEELDILVISNALHESNAKDWAPPNPSAFTEAEVKAVAEWVRAGGSLMLIADHQPFPGAAAELAEEFGIEFKNVYAGDGPPGARKGSLIFRKEEGSLAEHAVTEGIEAVANFGGSAFRVRGEHTPLLRLSEHAAGAVRVEGKLDVANAEPIGGWLQGALLSIGEGRVAVFAEAAMFSAQLAGPKRRPMGMNAPQANDNPRFLLNVMHWLSRKSEPAAMGDQNEGEERP